MAHFHTLTVTDIKQTIRDAVMLTLQPDQDSCAEFDFIQGQYLTFRREFDGEELRRCYSICSSPADGVLQVGIKRVEGGAFSSWANDTLRVGDKLEAMPPMGSFHTPLEPNRTKHYLGFAGGSGITPVLSILRTVLQTEPLAHFTLIYANRTVSTIMFRDELEDLKNTYMDRLSVLHILEHDAQDIELFTGRVDMEKCAQLFKHWIDPSRIETAFICGPEPMMLSISKALETHGLRKDQIKFELFTTSQTGRARRRVPAKNTDIAGKTAVQVTLDGETRSFSMAKTATLLEACLENNMDAPHACKAGVCSTCRAKVIAGKVEMIANHALEDYEVEGGYVLTCQCHPLTDDVKFSYDG